MGLSRRGFLALAAGAVAGALASPIVWKTLDDVTIWTQNWPWIPRLKPGENTFLATTTKMCPSSAGTIVRIVGGRPVTIAGNPEHPLGSNGVTALAGAEVQMLYSPSRVKTPLKRMPDGNFQSISWDEAITLLAGHLKNASRTKDSLLCISGDQHGVTANELLSACAGACGSSRFFLMPGEIQPAARAARLMGADAQPGYDLEKSDYVLMIGANALETWGPVIRNRRAFAEGRPHGEPPATTWTYCSATRVNSAAAVNSWVPVAAGTEAVFALGLAHLLIKNGYAVNAPDMAAFAALAAEFPPQRVSALTGAPEALLRKTAVELAASAQPIVLAGSQNNSGAPAATVMAAIALNMLLGVVNKEGGLTFLPWPAALLEHALPRARQLENDLCAELAAIAAGKSSIPDLALIYDANPVYALPDKHKLLKAYASIPFKACITPLMTETAMASDLVLPLPMGLERLDDVCNPYGCGKNVYSLCVPVLPAPLTDARPLDAILSATLAQAQIALPNFADQEAALTGTKPFTIRSLIAARAQKMHAKEQELLKGAAHTDETLAPVSLRFATDILQKAIKPLIQSAASETVRIAPMTRMALGTPDTAIPPFGVKLIRASELKGTELFALVNSNTAARLGLTPGCRVRLCADSGASLELGVNIYDGVMDNAIAVPNGYGHTAFDAFSRGKGRNLADLYSVTVQEGLGSEWKVAGLRLERV